LFQNHHLEENHVDNSRKPEEHQDLESLLELLADRNVVPGGEPTSFELRLAPELITRMMFIVSPEYGTRSSTALLVDQDGGVTFVERQFDAAGKTSGRRSHEFRITHPGEYGCR